MTETSRPFAARCGTCGATFPTRDALQAHLLRAYHGVQCLRCGALLADRRAFQVHSQRIHDDRPIATRARGA